MREERLEDALKYIDELLELLKNHIATNDTPEGRTIHELRWFKQEITAGRLTSLPAPHEQTSTLRYVFSEHLLDRFDPQRKRLNQLISLLDEGHYLMKPQFYRLVVEEIEKMLGLKTRSSSVEGAMPPELGKQLRSISYAKITPEQKELIWGYLAYDLKLLKARFVDGSVERPPVNWDDYMGATLATEKSIFGDDTPEEIQWDRLRCLIFEGLRPDPNGKIANRQW